MEQEIQLNKQECLPTCTTDFNPTLNDIIIYQTEDGEIRPMWLEEIAEQLKAGGENE